jgi:hypothetical protein
MLIVHYYTHGRNGDFVLQSPLVLGHESAGIITAVGPGVTAFKVGQRVAIEPGVFCKKCRYCLDGRYNLCENMRFASSAKSYPHLDGTLQGRMNHPIECLHAYVLAFRFLASSSLTIIGQYTRYMHVRACSSRRTPLRRPTCLPTRFSPKRSISTSPRCRCSWTISTRPLEIHRRAHITHMCRRHRSR